MEEIFLDKANYLKVILTLINKYFVDKNKMLIVLNNINNNHNKYFEEMCFMNEINFLFIFKIENNFQLFKQIFFDSKIRKKFFYETNNEISYSESEKKKNFLSLIYKSEKEYYNSRNKIINDIMKTIGQKEKILYLIILFNISTYIDLKNYEYDEITALKISLSAKKNYLNFLEPFCSILNFELIDIDNNCIIKDIKFKEALYENILSDHYKSQMINYINKKSNELFLDDIEGSLLEKDIIFNILTEQLKDKKLEKKKNFKKLNVNSLYCLDYNKNIEYPDNSNDNVIIIQDSKTAEMFDFSFKIHDEKNNNHMKFLQIITFKSLKDLTKLNQYSVSLDLINFDLKNDALKLGKIQKYSFCIITSIKIYNDFLNLKDKNKEKEHTFYNIREHCKKNGFEFFIFDYFRNKMFVLKDNDKIIECSNFFEIEKAIDLHQNKYNLYNFLKSSNKKLSLKLTKNNLLYPIQNYYQVDNIRKIYIHNIAKYEFNKEMINIYPEKNFGLAFWNYKNSKDKKFDNLLINYNGKSLYFKDEKIIVNKCNFFEKEGIKNIHALLFFVEEENIYENKEIIEFLKKKREGSLLYDSDFEDIIEKKRNKKYIRMIKSKKK